MEGEFRWEDWGCIDFESAQGGLDWRKRFDEVYPMLARPDVMIKSDHRSEVGLFYVDETKYIVKKFLLQKNWWWFRLTSMFFPSLGEVAVRNAVGLQESGLLTPQPSLLMQRREGGMVSDCWLIYRFLPGEAASTRDASSIIEYVRQMHDAGWVHRDPHPGNFLITTGGIATIDPVRVRRTGSKYLKAYDVMLMGHDMPEAAEIYGKERMGKHFEMARFGHDLVRGYRQVKRRARRVLGVKGKESNG